MKYAFYKTGHNERWDNIAYKYYKNSYDIQKLIEANPHIPINTVIPPETEITIPIEEISKLKKSTSVLPIWKQQ